jgi:hypothetical protein
MPKCVYKTLRTLDQVYSDKLSCLIANLSNIEELNWKKKLHNLK